MTLNFDEGLMKLVKVVTTKMVEDNDIICSPVDTDEDPFAKFISLIWGKFSFLSCDENREKKGEALSMKRRSPKCLRS